MSVVNVIDMTVVFDRGVAAAWGVLVTVVGMGVEIAHKIGSVNREFASIPVKSATLLNHTHCTNLLRIDNLAIEEIGKGEAIQKTGHAVNCRLLSLAHRGRVRSWHHNDWVIFLSRFA